MTGRRLYDRYADAYDAERRVWRYEYGKRCPPNNTALPAWPFLPGDERAMWNLLARKLTPTPRKRNLADPPDLEVGS